jgi:hypothetical protein
MKRTEHPRKVSPAQLSLERAAAEHAAHHHDDHLYDDEFLHNEDTAHEHTDVNLRQLLISTAALVATCVICALVVGGLFKLFERQAAAKDPQVSPLAVAPGQEPPEPRLLKNEPAALAKQRAIEAEMLDYYGWVDEKAGTVHMPIDEAKKKLLHDGLPVRAEGSAEPWLGSRLAARGEASGGRAILGGPSKADVRIQKLETEKKQEGSAKPPDPRKPH